MKFYGKKAVKGSGSGWTGTSAKDSVYVYSATGARVNTAAGNDSIYSNKSTKSTIDAGTGNDTIRVYAGNGSSINAGAGNDRISLWGGNNSSVITVTGGTGNDTIYGSGYKILHQYKSGDGNDVFYNWSANDTLQIGNGTTDTYIKLIVGSDVIVTVGSGKITLKGAASLTPVNILGANKSVSLSSTADTFVNTVSGATIVGFAGNDTITNNNTNAFIDGGAGADRITNVAGATGSTILGGTGNDYLYNYAANTKVNGDAGNDLISNSGTSSAIDGGAGNDNITNKGANSVIDGGTGNDKITNKGANSVIDAGAGKDKIYNYAANTTITGGTGNDSIKLTAAATNNLITYGDGDGLDTIVGFNATSTLKIGNGTTDTYMKSTVGSDVLITVGDGAITLKGAANLSPLNILGTEVSKNVTLTTGNDIHYNELEEATIQALAGNDTIYNYADKVSIDAGAGNDVIENQYDEVSIRGGTGNDSIDNYGSDVLFQYTNGDGNDFIEGFDETSTLKIGNGTTDTYFKSVVDSDVVINVGNGAITLSGAASLDTLNILGTEVSKIITLTPYADTYSNAYSDVTILALAGNDKVTNSGANVSLDGGTGNDTLYNTGDNVTLNGGAGNDFINNPNHGNNGKNSKIIGGDGNDTIDNMGVGGVTIDGGAGNDSIYSTNNFYNTTSISGGAGDDTINLHNNRNNDYVATVVGGTGNDLIRLNYDAEKTLIEYKSGDGNDLITGFSTLTTLKIGNGTTDTYMKSTVGSNVIVTVGSGTVTLSGAGSLSTLNILGTEVPTNVTINNYNNSTLISSGAGNDYIYNTGDKVTINTGDGNDTVRNGYYGDSDKIDTGDGDDYVYNGFYSHGTKISLGAGNDTLVNDWSDNVTINGGTGNDLIKLDIHTTHALIEYAVGDGNDTIYGYNLTDTIKLTNGSITGSSISGDDLILKTNSGSITLLNTRSVNINGTIINPTSRTGTSVHDFLTNVTSSVTLNGYGGDDKIANAGSNVLINTGAGNNSIGDYGGYTTIVAGNGNNTIYADSNSSVVGGTGNDSIHVGWSHATVNAGAGNDTILNYGKSELRGGAGNDFIYDDGLSGSTINGGTGNDTIYAYAGWGGKEIIEYATGDGNDIVYGYNANDTIKIAGKYTTLESGNDILITVGNGSILLKNAKGKKLNIVEDLLIRLTENADTYTNTLAGATVLALGGNDTVYNSYANVSLEGGAGNDSLYNYYGNYTTMRGGDGNDTINNYYGSSVLADGGAGIDYIYNYGTRSTAYGGLGNDYIYTYSTTYASIDGGVDNDYIYNSYTNYATMRGGDGVDTITNYGTYSYLDGGAGIDYIYNYGTRSTIYGGLGNDYIYNYTTYASINGGSGNNYIYNNANYATIRAGDGANRIYNSNSGDRSFIDLGAGNDSIYSSDEDYSTISGGAGADTITGRYWSSSISGGAGNDKISLYGGGSGNTINAGLGNDTIYGSTSMGHLYQYKSGDGNDIVYNFKSNDTLQIGNGITDTYTTATVGSDLIVNVGSGTITLKGAANLKPTIIPSRYIVLTPNNDTYINTLAGATVLALDGDDNVTNRAANVSLDGGAGNDSIVNAYSTSNVTLTGGDDNDTLINYGTNAVVSGGAGNDLIKNGVDSSYGNYTTLDGGAGNDSIYSNKISASITGGAGNDMISLGSSASNNLIGYTSGDGNDFIGGFNATSTLKVGNGTTDTYMKSTVGSNVIVTVSNGTITLNGAGSLSTLNILGTEVLPTVPSNIIYLTPNKDTYKNTRSNVTVLALGGDDNVTNSGANVSLDGGTGNDYLLNTLAANVTLNGGDGNDNVSNYYGNNISIVTGIGLDTVYNYGNSKIGTGSLVAIDTGADNDRIYNYGGSKVTITAGAGDDYIMSSKTSLDVKLDGGAGDDQIYSYGNKVTIIGGTGNDSIKNDDGANVLFEYTAGDGLDTIYGFNTTSTLKVGNGTTDTYMKATVGSDVVVTVGSGTITLNGAGSLSTLNILGTEVTVGSSSVTAQDVIKKFMGALDTTTYSGTAALNQAVSVASGGYYQNISTAINQMVADCRSASSGTAFLKDYCDIDLSNADTGAITGSDAGGSTDKTKNSIVPETGTVNAFTDNKFTVQGLTVQLSNVQDAYNPTSITYNDLSNNAQKYIWQAFQTWWANGALDLIAESYGDNFGYSTASSATVKNMYFGFYNGGSGTLAETWRWADGSGDLYKSLMRVNMYYYDSMIINNLDGKCSNRDDFYLDRVLAHEFTHAVMGANIKYFGDLPKYIKEGMAELTHGIDDERKSDIIALSNNPNSLSTALNSAIYYSYAGGYMFLRYLAKQGAEHYGTSDNAVSDKAAFDNMADSTVTVSGSVLTINNTFTDDTLDLTAYATVKTVNAKTMTRGIEIVGNNLANSIAAGKGSDTISGNVGNDTILGGAGNDIILGDAGNDLLKGDAGNDTLTGGTGNDTLTGGAGNDVFIHVEGGNEVITDYVAGTDKIKFVDEHIEVTSSSLSGSDVVLNVRGDTVTVKNAKGQKITIVDADGNETSAIYGGLTLNVNNSTASAVTLESSYANADASTRTTAIQITGNALNNSIVGGSNKDTFYGLAGDDKLYGNAGNDKLYGGAGADTLIGGAGNDSLWGDAGKDTFVYTAGKDVISGFENDDLLQIMDTFTASYNASTKEVAFKVGSTANAITLKDFTATTFHVNDDTYQISNNKFVKK